VNSIDVIALLLRRHPAVNVLTLFEPPPTPMLQDRLKNDSVISTIVAAGLRIRNDLGLPFWDSLLTACFNVGAAAVPVVEQAAFHNLASNRTTPFLASSWSESAIEQVLAKVDVDSMLVLSSRVLLHSGETRHIPMLDFHIPPTVQNQDLVKFIAKRLDPQGGFVLISGKSYHFYGKSLLQEEQLPPFLGNALLFSPLVDRAWIAHQMIEGACGLRISQKTGGGSTPTLLVEL
jgi:hypothetical protein